VILPDTSAWIEYLRATGTPAHLRLRRALSEGEPVATTEPVVMEVLAGARDAMEQANLGRMLQRMELLPVAGLPDYVSAADVYSTCRGAGETVRGLLDCLIAVVAMRTGASLLHADADFDAIARHTPLELASL